MEHAALADLRTAQSQRHSTDMEGAVEQQPPRTWHVAEAPHPRAELHRDTQHRRSPHYVHACCWSSEDAHRTPTSIGATCAREQCATTAWAMTAICAATRAWGRREAHCWHAPGCDARKAERCDACGHIPPRAVAPIRRKRPSDPHA